MKTIIINENLHDIKEIDLDISCEKNEIFNLLHGPGTFVGQFPDSDVVIMRGVVSGGLQNKNKLGHPFDKEEIEGPILLIRMDQNADHRDLTLIECKEKGWIH